MSNATFMFSPVKVEKGRKWKGSLAYRVSVFTNSFGNTVAKMWEPVEKKYVYSSAGYCEDVVLPEEEIEKVREEYINSVINGTIEWCAKQLSSSSETEVKKFARNVLRKHHPEMMERIDEVLPDSRDVAAEVDKTITWALTLKSRPCMIYGHHYDGGKPYPVKKQIEIAMNALRNKGISSMPGFNEVWELNLVIRGLSKYIERESPAS